MFRHLTLSRWPLLLLGVVLGCVILQSVGRSVYYNVFPYRIPRFPLEEERIASLSESSLKVDLVVASVIEDDTAWLSRLPIPNLNVVRYVNNDAFARYQPPASKGNEALIYLTYLHDNYPNFPDVAIFVHGQETAWHVEGTLLRNMTFLLSQLDLHKIQEKGYFNLRRSWKIGCPTWIDTTKTYWHYKHEEEPHFKEAWAANFDNDTVPDKLGGPCCSQFALSRETMLKPSKEQYRKHMDWLMQSTLKNRVSGRLWEHMWPKLFKGEANDCGHSERTDLCEVYGLCWEGQKELGEYKELWEDVERLKTRMSFFYAIWAPRRAGEARRRMPVLVAEIERGLVGAWRMGKERREKNGV